MTGGRHGALATAARAAALLIALIIAADWVPLLAGAGAWPGARGIGDAAKLAFVLVVAASVWGGRARAADPSDWARLAAAFGVIALGDLLFFLRQHVAGVAVFALAQVALIWRHGAAVAARLRVHGWQRHGRALVAAGSGAVALTVMAAVVLAWLAPGVAARAGGPRLAVGGVYALILAASLAAAWLAPLAGALPRGRGLQAAAGMTLFFVCDLTVAGGQLLSDPAWRAVARAGTFLAYAPALWLLARSGHRAWQGSAPRV